MKKLYLGFVCSLFVMCLHAQTPFERVYTTLNTKCQNASCHSATSSDALKFDGTIDEVYNQIFNHPSALYPASVAKYEQLVKPQHPYTSFLLRKIAGAQFDTDLAIDSVGEGARMLDTAGQPLTDVEIEFIRQWIRFGALKTYGANDPQPDYATIYQYYTDSIRTPFFQKPAKPVAGTGLQFRMGPVFLPTTGSYREQEFLQQQEVNFPYLPEVYEIDGFMNLQSHHFLLFKYDDSLSARDASQSDVAADIKNLGQVTPAGAGTTILTQTNSFQGQKGLTAAWQTSENLRLPEGTALMWDKRTWLDMNFHMKNYNATSVLPCDFYFNIYFNPRNPNTIPMESHLVNNNNLGQFNLNCLQLPPNSLPNGVPFTGNYDDDSNKDNTPETRYIWMLAGHTHKYGTAFYITLRDTFGHITDTIYDGQYNYDLGAPTGLPWDHQHPPIEYFNNGLLPVEFGKHHGNNSGLVANTTWVTAEDCIHFGFTTNDEMQLFYYMYTKRLPGATAVNNVSTPDIKFDIVPNPNHNDGKLVYTLNTPAKVEASILDLTGKTVAYLGQEEQQEGTHTVVISNGTELSGGIYFARLVVNGNAYNRKFVVAK